MRLLSRLFGRSKKPINVLAPVDPAKGTYALTESFRVKFRPAQNVPDALRVELIDICQKHLCVSACFLVDVLEQPTVDFKFLVNLHLDHADRDLPVVAPLMVQAFKPYPDIAQRGFVGANVMDIPLEQAAYRRVLVK